MIGLGLGLGLWVGLALGQHLAEDDIRLGRREAGGHEVLVEEALVEQPALPAQLRELRAWSG